MRVLALCRLLLRGGVYGLFVLCKLRPQGRLFLFPLAGQYNTFCFYAEQTRDKILAYAVELTGIEKGRVTGNLYEPA